MGTALCLHRGSRIVTRDELFEVEAPPSTATWFPLAHRDVLATVELLLFDAGFELGDAKLALSQGNTRFFGTLDLRSEIIPGVSLSVGVRNSTDKTFPLGFCAGHRVFVCDNLAFRSELLVTRRHTLHGQARFQEAIGLAVQALGEFRSTEAVRIGQMQLQMIEDMLAESLILRAYEQGIVSYRLLPDVIKAWRFSPPEFEARNLWSLLNAFTQALKPRAESNPQQFALQTIRLHALLEPTPPLRVLEPPKD